MAKGATSLIHPHERMAMGLGYSDVGTKTAGDLGGGTFGVGSVEGGGPHVAHMDADDGTDHKHLGDHERSGPPPIKHRRRNMHLAAHSDHGPHHMNSGHKPVMLGGRGGKS